MLINISYEYNTELRWRISRFCTNNNAIYMRGTNVTNVHMIQS